MMERMQCARCGTLCDAVLMPDSVHYGKWVCGTCMTFNGFIPKPDQDKTKYRRPKKHLNLVRKYSRGFCDMCLRAADELPEGQVLEGHHVLEYHQHPDSSRENVWILCTACHRYVHWTRTYIGKNQPLTGLVKEVAECLRRP